MYKIGELRELGNVQIKVITHSMLIRIIEGNKTLQASVNVESFLKAIDWKAIHNYLTYDIDDLKKELLRYREEIKTRAEKIERGGDGFNMDALNDYQQSDIAELHKIEATIERKENLQKVCSEMLQA